MKMATSSVSAVTTPALWFSCLLLLLVSPAHSLTCTSQTFKNNKKFDKCVDLPTLDAYLHYTYNATNSSLSIAFMAPPATPEGWIAWAINPTSEGMVGSQALLAFKSNNKVVIKTFDVSSYSSISESKLAFETWDLSAEASSNGNLVIYGSMKVAEKAKKLNQVWQAGGAVSDGQPKMHNFQPDNVNAKGTLVLEKSDATSPSSDAATTSPSLDATSPSSSSSSSQPEAPAKGGQSLIKSNPVSLFFGLLLVIAGVLVN